jgi:hypothetical protein
MLLRRLPEKAGAGPGIWRRWWQEDWPVRRPGLAGGRLSSPIGRPTISRSTRVRRSPNLSRWCFIAFHGSWNRAPGAQGGYNVVFQPLRNGATSGDYVVFADGLASKEKNPGGTAHRPSGFPVAPDGALFISDDKAGRIWRLPMRAIRTCRPSWAPLSLSPPTSPSAVLMRSVSPTDLFVSAPDACLAIGALLCEPTPGLKRNRSPDWNGRSRRHQVIGRSND